MSGTNKWPDRARGSDDNREWRNAPDPASVPQTPEGGDPQREAGPMTIQPKRPK